MMWISLFAFARRQNAAFLANHRAENDTGRSGQRRADGREDFVGAEFVAGG
jgi:hypothetical protein